MFTQKEYRNKTIYDKKKKNVCLEHQIYASQKKIYTTAGCDG
jgi:hypothetical protein